MATRVFYICETNCVMMSNFSRPVGPSDESHISPTKRQHTQCHYVRHLTTTCARNACMMYPILAYTSCLRCHHDPASELSVGGMWVAWSFFFKHSTLTSRCFGEYIRRVVDPHVGTESGRGRSIYKVPFCRSTHMAKPEISDCLGMCDG